jgi:hypothetical protein
MSGHMMRYAQQDKKTESFIGWQRLLVLSLQA